MAQRYATIAEVRLRLGPAFTDPPITDEIVQLYLDDTACFIDPTAWGLCTSNAHAYAAAHCILGSPYTDGIAGQIAWGALLTGESNGPASRSFGIPAQDAGDLPWGLSVWGRKFLEYRRARWGKGSAVLARTVATSRPLGGCRWA